MASKLRKFVHVRADGNQVFYRGHKLTVSETSEADKGFIVEITRYDETDCEDITMAVVRLAPSESVGEYFAPESELKEKK